MINKAITRNALNDRFKNLTFHAIVNESFIGALPMKESEISETERKYLTRYSYRVLDALGGFNALESAIDLDQKALQQNLFLASIHNICTETAKEATDRVMKQTDWGNPNLGLKSVVNTATLSNEEFKKFAKKAEGMNLDEVSNIIKDKIMTVIKDERDQYDKEEELNEELRSSLAETDKFSDYSPESYLDLVLDVNCPRHPVSVFSKIQESAMEIMSFQKVRNGADYFPIVHKTTFESLMGDFKDNSDMDVNVALEQQKLITTEEVCNIPESDRPKIATLISIIVYTMMETLKTMNIWSLSTDKIKQFVNAPINTVAAANLDRDTVLTKANELICECNTKDFTKLNTRILSEKLAETKKLSELAQEMLIQNVDDTKLVDAINRLDQNVTAMENVLFEMDNKQKKNAIPVKESHYENIDLTGDIAEFNKISNLYGRNPNVSEIRLKINPSGITSFVDVTCANESGQEIKKSFMHISKACESDNFIGYLTELFQRSKMCGIDKKTSIFINDGKGTKIELN